MVNRTFTILFMTVFDNGDYEDGGQARDDNDEVNGVQAMSPRFDAASGGDARGDLFQVLRDEVRHVRFGLTLRLLQGPCYQSCTPLQESCPQ